MEEKNYVQTITYLLHEHHYRVKILSVLAWIVSCFQFFLTKKKKKDSNSKKKIEKQKLDSGQQRKICFPEPVMRKKKKKNQIY